MNKREELKALNVKILEDGPVYHSLDVVGCVNGFFIFPYNYYWVVKGKMPLKYAQELENYSKTLKIRVAGGCEDWKAIDHCSCDELDEKLQELARKIKYIGSKEYSRQGNELIEEFKKNKRDEMYIAMYHIDTLEGLEKIVETIRNNKITTVW